jgi:hypothetical protein
MAINDPSSPSFLQKKKKKKKKRKERKKKRQNTSSVTQRLRPTNWPILGLNGYCSPNYDLVGMGLWCFSLVGCCPKSIAIGYEKLCTVLMMRATTHFVANNRKMTLQKPNNIVYTVFPCTEKCYKFISHPPHFLISYWICEPNNKIEI